MSNFPMIAGTEINDELIIHIQREIANFPEFVDAKHDIYVNRMAYCKEAGCFYAEAKSASGDYGTFRVVMLCGSISVVPVDFNRDGEMVFLQGSSENMYFYDETGMLVYRM